MHDPSKVARFRQLHEAGCFVLPNPWDVGSARLLQGLGFAALASTSSGLAWSMGRRDGRVSLEATLDHFRALAAAVGIPVNGDFLGGFARAPEQLSLHVERAAETGIAGLSIEDSTGSAEAPLFDLGLATERVAAARAAIDRTGRPLVLTARSEGFIVGRPDLDETLRRLEAFKGAGADCLYAPGLSTVEQVRALVELAAPLPVNVLVGRSFTSVDELAALGVRRISVGGALARAAWAGFLAAAREIRDAGHFTQLDQAVPFSTIDGAFD